MFELFESFLLGSEKEDIKTILADNNATGNQLIEAASIIERKVDRADFKKTIIQLTKPGPGLTTPEHSKISSLQPRGIVTFNYDSGHENSFSPPYIPNAIVPEDKKEMLELLQLRFNKPFLFKAHGSIDVRSSVILTYTDYRELIHLNPEYTAFLQYIITNFNLVFYGFGLSDLDFDLFIHEIVAKFGSPIHKHVIIKRKKDSELAKDILHKRRYGIHPLYIQEYSDFCLLLDDAMISINSELMTTVNLSLTGNLEDRTKAHVALKNLSEPGKKVVSNNLKSRKTEYEKYVNDDKMMFEYSELCYTLGIIDANMNKEFLINIVSSGLNHQPVARALTVLRSVLKPDDLSIIEGWIIKYSTPLPGDSSNRILNYCEHYIVYVKAKYRSS